MCNDIHALGLDDQMFETDYSRGESIDLMTVGGANSVWKTTSNHNGERTILKTSKFLKAYDIDRLELYELDAMVSAVNGNLQLSTLLESKNALAKASSSAWNHIMPLYSHCHSATVTPLASGTLTDYVTNYPSEHGGQTIDPLVKLRLALQVARGLYQTQMYSFGKPTFAHLDLNPSQYLVFHPQQVLSSAQNHIDGNVNKNNNIPILQINDFNRGRFLQWDEKNNTCSFQFSGCKKNTRGSRWHAPDRFIGCMDVNEKIDTFTLGGVFFFLLSDGQAPFFNTRQFDYHIKEGELPPLPRSSISDHPAFEALSEITARCRAFRIEDRPTSLEVVGMLEEKLRIIESSSIRRRKEWM
jgi:serine/threonine protein kinase